MKPDPKIINCWAMTYSKGDLDAGDIVLIANTEKGRTIIPKKFQWYFFTDKGEVEEAAIKILVSKGYVRGYELDGRYYKVFCDKKKFRDSNIFDLVRSLHSQGIQTYEADVGPAKRFLLDSGYQIEDYDRINLMYIDIETDDRSGSIEYETKNGMSSIKAKDRILSVCCVDRKGTEYFFHDTDEKKMLDSFRKFLHSNGVDMVVGWNSKDFDLPYIVKRMELHKIPTTYMRNILHEDMMRRVQYFYMKDPEARQNITSYSLNFISKYFLNEEKVKFEGGVYNLMERDFEKFKAYNIQDCHLLRKLEDKLGLMRLTYQMFQTCQCTAQNWSMVKTIDNFILSYANSQGIHYKTNESFFKEFGSNDEERDEYLGAFVLDPIPGYYEDVYDLDFKSLYPNIIRTFNISPETYDPSDLKGAISTPGTDVEGVLRGKASYSPEEGVIPKKIAILLEDREKIRSQQKGLDKSSREWKDLNVKQLVVKELANSIYGVIGNPYFRGFNVNMAESITGTGQYLIKYLKETYERKGRKVIYGDTDSVFVILGAGEEIGNVLRETNEELTEHLKRFGVRSSTIQLAMDKRISKFFIESKKKYVGETGGTVHYSGMECIKRDSIELVRSLQRDLISRIFRKDDPADLRIWIEGLLDDIRRGRVDPKQITIYKRIGKDADEYKGKEGKKYTAPVHIRIAKRLSQQGDEKSRMTRSGTIIPYIITTTEPLLDGVHIDDFNGEWDREYYWNQVIYPPLLRILEVVHPEIFWDQYEITTKQVRKIPAKLKKEMESDPYYKVCSRKCSECSGRITWEHAFTYANRQINEKWAIIPLCEYHHAVDNFQDGGDLNKEINELIALRRATPEDLAKYPRRDWALRRGYLERVLQHDIKNL